MNDVAAGHLPTRDDLERLQAAMLVMPQIELETRHYWADGMYCREVARPAGCIIVGKVHIKEHFYVICSGTILLVGDGYRETITGPRVIVSKPGTKRAVHALTDAVCITVHRTDKTDLDEIEAELVERDETALFDASNKIIQTRLENHP
mgnify:CR=1 FL=1